MNYNDIILVLRSSVSVYSEKLMAILPRLALSIGIFLVFYIASVIIKRIFFRFDRKIHSDKNHILRIAATSMKAVILCIGAIMSLGTLGINVNALIASLGLGGFALGFALKDALSNMLSGVLIIIYSPFKVGDRIVVMGVEGMVSEIDLRYTRLKNETSVFLIPNSSLFTNTIQIKNKAESFSNK